MNKDGAKVKKGKMARHLEKSSSGHPIAAFFKDINTRGGGRSDSVNNGHHPQRCSFRESKESRKNRKEKVGSKNEEADVP